MDIWNIFPRFGMFYHDKSGNPAPVAERGIIVEEFLSTQSSFVFKII
jgi:hypothetical protein